MFSSFANDGLWPRRSPAVMHFPDFAIKSAIAFLYVSFFSASFFGRRLQNPLPPPIENNSSAALFWTLEWDLHINAKEDEFIGLSLSDNFASVLASASEETYDRKNHRFNRSVDLTLSLQFVPMLEENYDDCYELNRKLPREEKVQLNSSRIALFGRHMLKDASLCPMISFSVDLPMKWWFNSEIASAARDGGLQVERRQARWGHKKVRIFILCCILIMYASLMMHAFLSRRAQFRVALGMRSAAYILLGLACLLNPFDFFQDDFPYRWLVPFGITLFLAALTYFPNEVHADLSELDRREGFARWHSRSRMFKIFQTGSKAFLLLLNLASIVYFNRKVAHAFVETDLDPLALAKVHHWMYWTFMDHFFFGFCIIPSLAFACIFFKGLSSLTSRLKVYPYSICRTHFILVSLSVLVSSVGTVSFLYLVTSTVVSFSQAGPWSQLNNWLAMQLLPSPSDIFAAEQVVICIATFIAIEGLGGITCPTSRVSEQSAGSALGHALLNPGSNPTVPSPRACASACPILVAPGIALWTVRLLCHCSHVTYKTKKSNVGKLTEELLQTGLPCEEDLDYKNLVLHTVIRREGPEDLDLVAFVATVPSSASAGSFSSTVGIVSFRGTATGKNIRTDFDYQLEPINLPHLRDTPKWSTTFVHRGFQTALLTLYDELCSAIRAIKCGSLWFTGHSLGGALATLLAAEFHVSSRDPDLQIGCCTFGSPRVADKHFAALFFNSGISSMRVVLERDPVTTQPPKHCSTQRCFKNRVFKHVHGLIRVSCLGHLILNPNFLEQQLRRLLHYTQLLTTAMKFCCCRTARNHKIRGYVAALRAVQVLEDSSFRATGADIAVVATELSDLLDMEEIQTGSA